MLRVSCRSCNDPLKLSPVLLLIPLRLREPQKTHVPSRGEMSALTQMSHTTISCSPADTGFVVLEVQCSLGKGEDTSVNSYSLDGRTGWVHEDVAESAAGRSCRNALDEVVKFSGLTTIDLFRESC